MNYAMADKVARAVLYEGYILYPYRPSVKTRQRWTFGGLYPPAYSEAQSGTDAAVMQTQCLAVGDDRTALEVEARFLHLVDRTVGQFAEPLDEWPESSELSFAEVPSLDVGSKLYQPWQEATERTITLPEFRLSGLAARPVTLEFSFPPSRNLEPIRLTDGSIVGVLVRTQQAINGSVEVLAEWAGSQDNSTYRITVRISNQTPLPGAADVNRDDALVRTLISTHALLGIKRGRLVSQTDPPEALRHAAEACKNVGAWPVLVGETGDADTMLASPIILSDYPQVAPESPGDLFDSTEIDEILTLRIMTLTDKEKREMAGIDDRAAALLSRTEALAREQLMALHGTIRPTSTGSGRPNSSGGTS